MSCRPKLASLARPSPGLGQESASTREIEAHARLPYLTLTLTQGVACNFLNNAVFGPPTYELAA